MDDTTVFIESVLKERKKILKSLKIGVIPPGQIRDKKKRASEIIKAVKIMNNYTWDIKKYIK